jgi:hypothetical protein
VRAELDRPLLSIVVVVHRMREQALRTLLSLSAQHQRGAASDAYEIVVVENASDQMLDEASLAALGANIRYLRREESATSPAPAVNFGVANARGEMVAIMVDGARMVTPGLVAGLLNARRITEDAVVAVPGYHLGSEPQQRAVRHGYDETREARLLETIDWPSDGYRLFEIACLSGSCAAGFFVPMPESTCLGLPKRRFLEIGGCDERFDLPGGGFVNLDLYRRVCEIPGTRLFLLPGEGTFHQFHGGVTTGGHDGDRDALIRGMRAQYRSLRGVEFQAPARTPECLGAIPRTAQRFVQLSAQHAASTGEQDRSERAPDPIARAAPSGSVVVPRSAHFSAYAEHGMNQVEGWVPRFALELAQAIATVQEQLQMPGGACEIGVHHGRFFIGLMLLLQAEERALAIDLFEQQHLNLDGAGAGDLGKFLANLDRHGCDRSRAIVREVDSMALEPQSILDALGERPRLFSVDGGHTASVVEHDLFLAERTLAAGGAVFVSDYFNGAWPGVSEGVNRYFLSGASSLRPVAIGGNKLVFAANAVADRFRRHLAERFSGRVVRLFDGDVIYLER